MKKEDIMRRISAALDSADGLTGDPALQAELREDPESAKYAKDLTRIGKWLATWPLPEPDDAAFETLASRIEQRFDESLGAMSDPTAAPVFDDDDALRDATARLLNSGEFPLSDSSIELISDPSSPGLAAAPAPPSEAKPLSPIAKVTLSKARVPAIVEESSGSGEPLSAAELELRLGAKPPAAKKIGPAEPGTPAAKKKKKKKPLDASTSSDRISIPTPKPGLSAPTLSPVVQLPKADDRKPATTFWWFAAAAAVGLGVFGAATLFESQAEPSASVHGSTLVTTGAIQPTTPAVAEAPLAAVPMVPPPPPELEAADHEAMEQQRGLGMPPATAALGPVAMHAHRAAETPSSAPVVAPTRIAAASGTAAAGPDDSAHLDDMLGDGTGGMRRRSAGGGGGSAEGSPPSPTTTATTAAPSPPREDREPVARAAPPPVDPSTLPDTPDRSTIQAVLAARTTAVSACTAGAHGLADVDIVIAGSGRVTTATVNGSFAGTPIGSCIARAVRGATFPPFSQPRFEVTYPYHL